MRLFDVLVMGLVVAAVVILIRIILGTPLVKRVAADIAESFVSGGLTNTMTECPGSATMYMHDGAAYCCSGKIMSADSAKDTCRPLPNRDSTLTFCTLGPAKVDVPNCLELRAGLMQAEGEKVCPPSLPNFVRGPKGSATEAGRCCYGPANETYDDCTGGEHCNVGDANIFKDPTSCGFLKAQHDDVCPSGFGRLQAKGQGPLADLTLHGCTNSSQNCYSVATLKRLVELGYDVNGLPSCSSH